MRENSAVPEGLESFFYVTQHSAFGCVLGYHVPAPWGLILVGLYHHRNPTLVLTHTLKSARHNKNKRL